MIRVPFEPIKVIDSIKKQKEPANYNRLFSIKKKQKQGN